MELALRVNVMYCGSIVNI